MPGADIRVVLTWGLEPDDLDAHLSGPICGTVDRFHVSYLDKNPVPYADLDRDDADGYGPETITIRPASGMWLPGEYDFWVHNVFSGSPDFGESSAVVTVFQGDTQVEQYSVADEPGVETTTLDIWRVVNLMVDELGNLTVNRDGHGFLPDWDGANTVPPPVTVPTVVPCP